jgi:hypothetical protein
VADARVRVRLPSGARPSTAVTEAIELELFCCATHRSVEWAMLLCRPWRGIKLRTDRRIPPIFDGARCRISLFQSQNSLCDALHAD